MAGSQGPDTMLPGSLKPALQQHLQSHKEDPPARTSGGDTVGGPSGKRPEGGDRQAGDLPHPAPLLRHPPADGRLRHSDRPGAPRAQERRDDDDLHPRPQPRGRDMRAPSTHSDAYPTARWSDQRQAPPPLSLPKLCAPDTSKHFTTCRETPYRRIAQQISIITPSTERLTRQAALPCSPLKLPAQLFG